ncbi:APC family permease [uncultured Jatrophihabitans sp.]|uniref:APC family permease n=1 Tax=uncultured Jatrophihabitans sp. TaxID=1610747 RepID=UPI0035CA6178
MTTSSAATTDLLDADRAEDARLRRGLGFWGLTAIGFSNIFGSGWLFAAMYAAQTAGPAALLSWVLAGALCLLIALVIVDLGGTRPAGGATVRWPRQSNGQLVASVVGVSVLLTVGGTAAEVSAILGYADRYLPWLQSGSSLTVPGVLVAMGLAVLLSALNWYGVKLFSSLNNVITVVKFVVPALTVVALIASGFHPSHLHDHGGFAPYGYGAVLSALAAGGIVYSVNGFQAAADFSGEARDPRRDVPRAIVAAIVLSVVAYLLLQVAFLFAVPESALGHGWNGVNFDSPFGQLALVLNLQWLSTLLYADAVVSPGGSAYVGVAVDARHTYALAANRVLPRFFLAVERRSGIPRRALLLNLAVILVFLLPFSGWQDIVSVVGDLYLLTYAAVAVSAAVLAEPGRPPVARWIPPMRVLAPVSFIAATEFVYWSGWHDLRLALPLTLVGVPLYLATARNRPGIHVAAELRRGAWIVVYLLLLVVLSALGSFGGHDAVGSPWDTLLVAALGAGTYAAALSSGRRMVGTGAENAATA